MNIYWPSILPYLSVTTLYIIYWYKTNLDYFITFSAEERKYCISDSLGPCVLMKELTFPDKQYDVTEYASAGRCSVYILVVLCILRRAGTGCEIGV